MERETVLVTGVTGFIASWVMHDLLGNGYNVIGTIRSGTKKRYQDYYDQIACLKEDRSRLKIVEVNILDEKDFYPLVKQCKGVFHISCPLPQKFNDKEEEMLKPSVQGILSVLKAASQPFSTVKRVIFTSSASAVRQIINNPNLDYEKVYSDDDYNQTSTLEADAYGFAKLQGELKAFEYYHSLGSKCPYDLVCVNPTLVIGPVIHDIRNGLNYSNHKLLNLILQKREISAVKNYSLVDVRDVSQIHIKVYQNPDSSGKRFFLTTRGLTEVEMIETIRQEFPKHQKLDEVFRFDQQKRKSGEEDENGVIKRKELKFELKNLKSVLGIDESKLINSKKSLLDLFKGLLEMKYFEDYDPNGRDKFDL